MRVSKFTRGGGGKLFMACAKQKKKKTFVGIRGKPATVLNFHGDKNVFFLFIDYVQAGRRRRRMRSLLKVNPFLANDIKTRTECINNEKKRRAASRRQEDRLRGGRGFNRTQIGKQTGKRIGKQMDGRLGILLGFTVLPDDSGVHRIPESSAIVKHAFVAGFPDKKHRCFSLHVDIS